jgi:hypothetical protein
MAGTHGLSFQLFVGERGKVRKGWWGVKGGCRFRLRLRCLEVLKSSDGLVGDCGRIDGKNDEKMT